MAAAKARSLHGAAHLGPLPAALDAEDVRQLHAGGLCGQQGTDGAAGRIQPRLHEAVAGRARTRLRRAPARHPATVSQSGAARCQPARHRRARGVRRPLSVSECRRLRGGRARPGKGAWQGGGGPAPAGGRDGGLLPLHPSPGGRGPQARGELRLQLRHRRGRDREGTRRSGPCRRAALPGRRHRLCPRQLWHRLPAPPRN